MCMRSTCRSPRRRRTGGRPSTRFAVIGDYGIAGQPEADVAALVDRWGVDAIVTVGDNNYPNGAAETIDANVGQYYHAYIAPYVGSYGAGAETNRFFPALGNHDWRTDEAAPYLAYFTLPGNERYYTVRRGPVEFFILDSDEHEPDGITADSVQAQWLRAQLAASDAPWKLVILHHTPYTSSLQRNSNRTLQWPFAGVGGHGGDRRSRSSFTNGWKKREFSTWSMARAAKICIRSGRRRRAARCVIIRTTARS